MDGKNLSSFLLNIEAELILQKQQSCVWPDP